MKKSKILFAIGTVAIWGAVVSLANPPAPPVWWQSRVGIQGEESPKSPATISQLKNMAHHLHVEMEEQLPGGAGFSLDDVFPARPDNPDAEWFEAQRRVASIAQVKHVASRFYERLNGISSQWVSAQMALNDAGLVGWPHPFPWNPNTPVSENMSPVSLGQLKLVFSLRIREDSDSDNLSDLAELFLYGDLSADGLTSDYDGDGLTDFEELNTYQTSIYLKDTDSDGVSDGDEVAGGTDPDSYNAPLAFTLDSLRVLTPLD